jgi:hypothetical protein
VRKYYLDEVTDKYNDGRWELKRLVIGIKQDKGILFKIGALLVNNQVHEVLINGEHSLSELPLGQKFNEIYIERR